MKNYLLRRFFAFYIDAMICSIILHILLHICNISIVNARMLHIMLIFTALYFCYFVFSDFFFSKTLGKKVMRLKINGFDQRNKVKLLKQIIIRNLFRWVPFDQISIFFYDDYRMWHDMVSGTTVLTQRKEIK